MKKRSLLVLPFLAIASVASVISLSHSEKYSNQIISAIGGEEGEFIVNESYEVKDSYFLGDSFTFPKGKISYTDEQGTTSEINVISSYLIYPNDNVKSVDKIKLDDVGKYTIVAIGDYKGTKVVAKKTFNVYSQAYSVSSDFSSIEFGQLPTVAKAQNGLTVTLKEGDTFTYNQPINIHDSVVDGEPLVNFAPHCFSENAAHPTIDAGVFNVKFTDLYDPNNFVEVEYKQESPGEKNGDIRHQYYVRARGSSQTYTGLEANSPSVSIIIDGVGYRLHSGNSWGASPQDTSHVVSGHEATQSNGDDYGLSIYYDDTTKRIYTKHIKTLLITDLDEPGIYGANSFKGFTTGEVIVSIKANAYEESSAKIDIHSFLGRKGDQLSNTVLIDDASPIINVANSADNFRISKNEPFVIPSATMADLNKKGKVNVDVYYEKGTTQESYVPVINNTFTPMKAGNYTICYSAEDLFGNVGVAEKHCFAVTTSTGKANNLTVAELTNVKAGETRELPEYNLETLNNGAFINVKAIFEDGEVVLPRDNKIFFSKVGTYEIVYEYGDSVSVNEKRYTVEAVANSEHHYIKSLTYPKYLIKGQEFSFENYNITLVDSKELKSAIPDGYVDFGNGYQKINDLNKVMVSGSSNKASFQFKYKNNVVKEVKDVPIVDVGLGNQNFMKNYFVGNVTTSYEQAVLVNVTGRGNQTVDFVNSLTIDSFGLSATLKKNNYSKLIIRLSDYYNEDYSEIIEITPTDVGYKLLANNISIETSSFDLAINENLNDRSIVINNTNAISMPLNFTNGRIYLSFEFYNVSGDTSFLVKKINNQTMSSSSKDSTAPQIFVENIGGTMPLNSKVAIVVPVANDVLSTYLKPNLVIDVSYYDGAKYTPVRSVDGVLLDGTQDNSAEYEFITDKFGIYYINYSYTDQAGKQATNVNVLFVNDNVAPTITVSGGYNEKTTVLAKFGQIIDVKSFTVTDNLTPNDKIEKHVFVMTPLLAMINVTDTMQFTASLRGDYKVCYYATDEEGNSVTTYYTVRVK